jgi:hypothetical protein
MGAIKCFDVVSLVVNEATNQFSPLWKTDEGKLNVLKQYCSVIDKLVEEYDGESFEVDVNEIKMTVCISSTFEDITIQEHNQKLNELVKRANSVSFRPSEDGEGVTVDLVFPSVWERA